MAIFYRGRLCCSGSSCHDYHYHLSEFYGIQDRWQCTSHFYSLQDDSVNPFDDFGFVRGAGTNPVFTPMVGKGLSPMVVLGQLMIAILFAFEGWTNVGAIAGEMKNPGKDLPVAIVGGVSLIMAVYFIINLAYLWVLPASELATLTAPASAVAVKILGKLGGQIVSIGIIVSVFGSCNGFILSGSRVAYSLAAEGKFPFHKTFAKFEWSTGSGKCNYACRRHRCILCIKWSVQSADRPGGIFKLDILHTDIYRCDQTQKRPSKCSENL